MTQDVKKSPEVPHPRPRQVIETELAKSQEAISEHTSTVAEPIIIEIRKLPEKDRDACVDLMNAVYDREVLPDEISETFKSDVFDQQKVADMFAKDRELIITSNRLMAEMLPYLRDDFQKKVADLSARLDYAKLFENHEKGVDPNFLMNSIHEFIEFRQFQYELLNGPTEGANYHYYESACTRLEQFLYRWTLRDILRVEPDPDYQINPVFGQPVKEARLESSKNISLLLEFVEKYQDMVSTYHWDRDDGSLNPQGYRALKDLQRYITNPTRPNDKKVAAIFDEFDFDPYFVSSLNSYILSKYQDYAKRGILPDTAETTQVEKNRIDQVDLAGRVAKIEFEGFNPPVDKKSVVTEDEIREILRTLPPDFLDKIISIKLKPRSELETDTQEEGAEYTLATYRPILDELGKHVAGEISSYYDIFVAQSSGDKTIWGGKHYFMYTLMHEIGHNVHSMLRHSEMSLWESVVEDDNTDMTSYVARSKAKSKKLGRIEDFSETFSIFISKPLLLKIASPGRFMAMTHIFCQRYTIQNSLKFLVQLEARLEEETKWLAENDVTPDNLRKILFQ